MRALVLRLALATLLAGCASAPEGDAPRKTSLFAVVPGANGHVGAVVVEAAGQRQVIDAAHGARRVGPDGRIEAVSLAPEDLRAFAATLAALPGRPAIFTLYFLEGRDELTAESRAEMERVVGEIGRRPMPDIVVTGHTDRVGNEGFNDRLSLARAERMRELLVARGLARERILAAGRGERELLVPTADNVAEPRNRRVEINVR